MVWYNPFTWFKAEEELKCDFNNCRGAIRSDSVVYSHEFNEFYHPGKCLTFAANAHRALNAEMRGGCAYELISRKRAFEIKRGLEQNVEPLNPLSN